MLRKLSCVISIITVAIVTVVFSQETASYRIFSLHFVEYGSSSSSFPSRCHLTKKPFNEADFAKYVCREDVPRNRSILTSRPADSNLSLFASRQMRVLRRSRGVPANPRVFSWNEIFPIIIHRAYVVGKRTEFCRNKEKKRTICRKSDKK